MASTSSSAWSRPTGGRRPRRSSRVWKSCRASSIPYRGVELQEFDLDAALARKPRLIVVDELAHTNAPGVAPRQALAGRRGAPRRRHRRLLGDERPASREPQRRRRQDHRHPRLGDGARPRVRRRARGRARRPPAGRADRAPERRQGLHARGGGERAAELLPQGQPDRAARDGAAPHGGARRPADARVPDRRGHRGVVAGRRADRRLRRPGSERGAHRPRRRARRRADEGATGRRCTSRRRACNGSPTPSATGSCAPCGSPNSSAASRSRSVAGTSPRRFSPTRARATRRASSSAGRAARGSGHGSRSPPRTGSSRAPPTSRCW